jgi:hypothetical protein
MNRRLPRQCKDPLIAGGLRSGLQEFRVERLGNQRHLGKGDDRRCVSIMQDEARSTTRKSKTRPALLYQPGT